MFPQCHCMAPRMPGPGGGTRDNGCMSGSRDPWAGLPPGAQPVMVFCEREGHRKFLGRGWTYRFADGFPATAFDLARGTSRGPGLDPAGA